MKSIEAPAPQGKLTDRQKRFADEYMIDINTTRAYKAAYPNITNDKTASAAGARLLANVRVRAYIDNQIAEIQTVKLADAKEVGEYLTAVLRGEAWSEVVVIESIGEYKSVARRIKKLPDGKERLKAAELLGKLHGIFSEKLRLEVPIPVIIHDDLSLED